MTFEKHHLCYYFLHSSLKKSPIEATEMICAALEENMYLTEHTKSDANNLKPEILKDDDYLDSTEKI